MVSLIKWIGKLLKKIGEFLIWTLNLLGQLLSSLLAWVVAGLAWVIYQVFGWIGNALNNFFGTLADFATGDLPVQPLANFIVMDVLALDVAYTAFAVYFSVWLACRANRAFGIVIRGVLDII